MKNINKFLVASFLFTAGLVNAQTGIGTTTPDASAVLDVASSSKGFLVPRHSNLTRDAIALPAKGLMIFNITANELQTNTGTPASPIWTASGVGPAGPQGPAGTTGAQGLTGATGPQGPIGLTGPAGTNGTAVLNGTTVPAAATGANGDFYINTATNTIFGPKAGGAWPATGTSLVGATGAQGPIGLTGATGSQGIQGVAGATGATGPQGPIGLTGAAGTNGTNGIDGKTVLNGTTTPAAATGANGDFYINTATNTIFGPKAGGAWPATGTSLVGPTGAQGPAGSNASVVGSAPISVASGVVSLNDTGVTTVKLADGAVTMAKINQSAASSGQVIKWNGTAWSPAEDDNNAAAISNLQNSVQTLTTVNNSQNQAINNLQNTVIQNYQTLTTANDMQNQTITNLQDTVIQNYNNLTNAIQNPAVVNTINGNSFTTTVNGTTSNPITLPSGPTGATGPQGPAGPAGSNASVTGTAPIAVTSGVVSLNDAGVTTAKLADNAVTIAKLPAGATASTYLRGDGTWATISNTPAALNVTVPTTNDYTILETDAIIYRNLTANGTLTIPASLPAGKVFYIANTSGSFDWTYSPMPINTGMGAVAAGQGGTIVTLGGGQFMFTSGY